MFARLLLIFVLVPLIDLVLLLGLSKLTSWTWTVLIVVVSGILGAWLAKRQTSSVGTKIRDQLVQNNVPAGLLTDGAMILFAAGLLVTPGLITDVFGLTLLVPSTRAWYKKYAIKWLKTHLKVHVSKMNMGNTPFQSGGFETDIVDGEVVSSTETNDPTVGRPKQLQ